MSETCTCGRPTRDAAYTCDQCTAEFQQALAETPWLVEQLEITLTRQKGVDYRAKNATTGGSKETPLPVDYGAFSAASALRTALLTWVKHCHDTGIAHQSPKTGLPILETAHMSRWLMWRIDGLALNPDGPAAMADITRAVTRGKRVIDRPADKWFAGPCTREVGDQICGRDLYATLDKPQVKCSACHAVYNVGEQRGMLYTAAKDHLATASEIARAITVLSEQSVDADTAGKLRRLIADWCSAGRLQAKGTTEVRGKPSTLYRVGDVDELVKEYIRKKRTAVC